MGGPSSQGSLTGRRWDLRARKPLRWEQNEEDEEEEPPW